MKNKNAAMEMSFSAVIYIIIGMVVLGLVIGYVTNMFSNTPDIPEKDSRLLNEVCDCNDNLCLLPKEDINIKKGEKENIYIKARGFDSEIDCKSGYLENGVCEVSYMITDETGTETEDIKLKGPGFLAKDGKSDCQTYNVEVEGSVPIGTYYMRIYLYKDSSYEKSQTLTLNVE